MYFDCLLSSAKWQLRGSKRQEIPYALLTTVPLVLRGIPGTQWVFNTYWQMNDSVIHLFLLKSWMYHIFSENEFTIQVLNILLCFLWTNTKGTFERKLETQRNMLYYSLWIRIALPDTMKHNILTFCLIKEAVVTTGLPIATDWLVGRLTVCMSSWVLVAGTASLQ